MPISRSWRAKLAVQMRGLDVAEGVAGSSRLGRVRAGGELLWAPALHNPPALPA